MHEVYGLRRGGIGRFFGDRDSYRRGTGSVRIV